MTVERILLRADSAAAWTTVNPVLALREPGLELDTQRLKIGDGVTAWSSLPYAAALPADVAAAQAAAAVDATSKANAAQAAAIAATSGQVTDTAMAGALGATTATAIAGRTELRAAFVPKWKPNTAYAAGEPVLNPSGQTVTANSAFTSGATYSASNWTVVSGGGGTVSDATTSAKGIVQLAGDLGGTAASPTVPGLAGKLAAANNLSDLASAATARTNLGLGSAATQASTAFDAAGAASAAQGASLQKSSNLSDLANAATARTNLGLGSAAVQPLPVLSRRELFVSAYQSVPTANATTAATFTFRATHTLTQAVAGFRLVMPLGFNVSNSQTACDVLWSGSTAVKVSVEIAGAIRPVTWSGTRVKTNDPGGALVSDLIAADLPSGTQVPVRVMVPTSTLYPNTVGTAQGPGATASGDGYTNGSDISDAMTAVSVAITAGYFCHGLIGAPVSTPKAAVAFIGDSITMGTGDATNNGGWTAYASNGVYPNLRLAVGGAAAQGWVGAHTYSWPYLAYCTHAVVMLGANDLTTGNGPRTYTQFQGDLTSIYTAMRNRGLKVYGCTVLPRTTSTDAWATTTNQTAASTAFAAGGSSTRGQINAWIRGGAGGLLDGYFETADAVESARDSGLWKASYTTDGAHPTATAHQAIATNVNLAGLSVT